AEDGIRDFHVTGVQTCALPIFAVKGFCSISFLTATDAKTPQGFARGFLCVHCELLAYLAVKFFSGKNYLHPGTPTGFTVFNLCISEERRVGKEAIYRMAASHEY